jgi:hypothetical protein
MFFYLRGVPRSRPDGLRLDIESLQGVSFTEMSALIAFLESLSGAEPRIAPPKLP